MISKEEVKNLAELARLELTEEETAKLQTDMSNILDYIGQVSAVKATEPEAAVFPVHNVLRADVPRAATDPLAGKEEALRNAFPEQKEGYNVVRKIIQKDE